jgi:hypothetical protein
MLAQKRVVTLMAVSVHQKSYSTSAPTGEGPTKDCRFGAVALFSWGVLTI